MSADFSNRYTTLAMTIVAALCGFFIVSAYQYTRPYIVANQRQQTEAAALAVLPHATQVREVRVNQLRWFEGRDAHGKSAGIAIEASGRGFVDQIKLLYAYNPQSQRIQGIKVVESKETPGIGDKIIADVDFHNNFKNLPVQHALATVKHGKKTQDWQIDGISGATISSKAVTKLLQASMEATLPTLDSVWRSTHVAQ